MKALSILDESLKINFSVSKCNILELDMLGIAHPHINSDVAEGERISVTSGSLTMSVLYR